MTGPVSLTARIRARARELGFDRVGVSPARRAERAAAFRDWLELGYHGEMGYLARDPEMRADPKRRDAWARSVVSASMNYLPARDGWEQAPGILPAIARYAAGDDYHNLMKERLERLLDFIREEAPGAHGRVEVDTSPLLEREFAEASGLGWFAKNTMILDGEIGSWTLIGEIVLDLELDHDLPLEDRCGSCRACLDGCPTGAILEDGVLDATRCISYYTIELRGAIPKDHRAEVGGHLFGCDICQEVCPWNRKAPETAEAVFRPRAGYAELSLADIARMTEARFQEVFAGSAIRRAKRRGMVRNALIAGANTGDEEVVSVAHAALEDPDPVVRGSAAWTLGLEGSIRDRAALDRALERETDPAVAVEIREALDQTR